MITADNLITKCQRECSDIGGRVEPADWYYYFTEAIRELRAGRTFPWQRKPYEMEFFSDVFQYALPADFDSMIKPYDKMFEKSDEGAFLVYGRDKDFFANANISLALSWNRENPMLLARIDGEADTELDSMADEAAEYTVADDGNTPVQDDDYYDETTALRLNITNAAGYATIERTIDGSVDLTDYLNKGSVFLGVFMPTVLSSVEIRYGSDNANYYEITGVTTDVTGAAFSAGNRNILKFDMENATVVGSPDITAINYYRIKLNHAGITDTDFRLDNLYFRLGNLVEFPYNSKYVVKDNASTYKESVEAGTDVILGDETFESVVKWKAIEKVGGFKLRDIDLRDMAAAEFKKVLIDFNRRYPSTEAPLQSNYFRNYNKF